jgi:hypothetical protein
MKLAAVVTDLIQGLQEIEVCLGQLREH